jgi:general secretion pathway protein G
MEEKIHEIRSSFRSFFNSRVAYKFLFRKSVNPLNHGFTLIEILIVIAIIGILATGLIMIIDPSGQLQRSKDGRRKSDMEQIRSGLELYRADEGGYPTDIPNCGTNSLGNLACDIIYLQNVPIDPLGPSYYYVLTGTGGYEIYGCAQKATTAETVASTPALTSHFLSKCKTNRYFKVVNP